MASYTHYLLIRRVYCFAILLIELYAIWRGGLYSGDDFMDSGKTSWWLYIQWSMDRPGTVISSSGMVTLYEKDVSWSGRLVHPRLWMNEENMPCESSLGKLITSQVSFSFAQQQVLKLCGSGLHLQVWDPGCNTTLLSVITVLRPGTKRFTSMHTETAILTKVENWINFTVFNICNLLL